MRSVINMDVLPLAALYPFITGIKFITLFVLVCAYWVALGFCDDAGFENEPAVGKAYLWPGPLFLTARLMAGWVTGDYNIWKAEIPGRWHVLFGYSIVLPRT